MLNIAMMTTASYLNGKFVLKLGAETMLQIGYCGYNLISWNLVYF